MKKSILLGGLAALAIAAATTTVSASSILSDNSTAIRASFSEATTTSIAMRSRFKRCNLGTRWKCYRRGPNRLKFCSWVTSRGPCL